MKTAIRLFAVFIFFVLTLTGTDVRAQQPESTDKTLSPYFFVRSESPENDRLPLKSTSAEVNIAGVIADVKVTQVYQNEGRNALEAIYVFPASNRAAVHAMKMTIGERTIVAKVKTRGDARREYDQAKQQGKSASLLEQQRPNVFQMNVANIMPGDEIKVEMSYTELLVPRDKEYEFVYPTVVGPRYSNRPAAAAAASEHWVHNPYLHQGEASAYSFDVNVNIAAGMEIRKIVSPSHQVDIRYRGGAVATISLDKSEHSGGNRDFILKYRLAGEQIESGLLLTEGEKENFFLLMLQPPKRVKLKQIPGREYIFIVDISGSMHGYPLEISKKLLKDLIGNLRPTDTFNVLLFAGGNSVLSEQSLAATPDNIAKAITVIERQQGGGGTELLPALKRALSLPRSENVSRSVIIATDGYVSVEAEAFDLIRNNLGNANMFAFGIGSAVNRHLIEGIARAGMGEPLVITKPEEASAQADAFRSLVQSPVLTGIRMDFGGFDVYDLEPLGVPDVLADRPVILFGKWRGKPQGTITIRGVSGEGAYLDTVDLSAAKPEGSNSGLRYLWARHRIAMLSDYNLLRSDDTRVKEVTELGLAYNLLTNFTSFVAVNAEIRNRNGQGTTVTQPLPLPQGVTDYAVGGYGAAASPAPTMYRQKTAAAKYYAEAPEPEKKEIPGSKIIKVTAKGELTDAGLRWAIERQISSLDRCLSAVRSGTTIKIKLMIDGKGAVESVEIDASDIPDKKARECMKGILLSWTFDRAAGNRRTSAEITIRTAL